MQAHGALFEKTTVNGKVTSARAIIGESDDLDTNLLLLDKGHWKHVQMSNQELMHIISIVDRLKVGITPAILFGPSKGNIKMLVIK